MSLPYPYNNSFLEWHQDDGTVGTPPIIPPASTGQDVMYETSSYPVLQGRVSRSDTAGASARSQPGSGGKWDAVLNILGSVLDVAAAAAKGYVSGLASGPAPAVNTSTNLSIPEYKPVNYQSQPVSYQQITVNQHQHLGQQAMARVSPLQAQADREAVQQAHQRATRILDQLAQAQGLPTYKEFHAQNGLPYPAPPNPGTLGIAQIQNQNSSNPWIQEDQYQIQANLQHAQTPLQLDAWQARLQTAQQQAENIATQQVPHKPLIADSGEIKTNIPNNLIAESGTTSLRYHDVTRGEDVMFGERETGPKSIYPALPLTYSDKVDLAVKLYEHFVTGEGQPVEISLNKLNFSKFIDIKDLLSSQAREKILSMAYTPKNKTKIEHTLSNIVGTKIKIDGSKDKITIVEIPALNKPIGLDISLKSDAALFAAFGKITAKVKKIDIYINQADKKIFVEGEIEANRDNRLLDRFDFDPAKREWYKEALTRAVHTYTPPGSTSFNIFIRKGSHSDYKRNYQLKDFLH